MKFYHNTLGHQLFHHHEPLTHELTEHGIDSLSKRKKEDSINNHIVSNVIFNGELKFLNHHKMQSRFLCQVLEKSLPMELGNLYQRCCHACSVTLDSEGYYRSTCKVRNVFALMPL